MLSNTQTANRFFIFSTSRIFLRVFSTITELNETNISAKLLYNHRTFRVRLDNSCSTRENTIN
jgi:hypothetical protein